MKKVAVILTEYRYNSHAEVILGRLLGRFEYEPQVEVVSLYTDQVPENDLSRMEAKRKDIPIFPTIDEAISVGDSGVKIDGVIIIGEHGDYPMTEKGQKMYPRRRLFEETFKALDRLGLRVPIFSDKHLAYDFADAQWIYEGLQSRNIPFYGGSSIPLTDYVPEPPQDVLTKAKEILVISYGGVESYGFHGMEVLQSVAEQRQGGETGVCSIEALQGKEVYEALDRGEWSEELLLAALKANPTWFGEHPRDYIPEATLFIIEYNDGTKGYVIQLQNFVNAWSFAVKDSEGNVAGAICDAEHWRPFGHFARLTNEIEKLIINGKSTIPAERTFMTTGLIDIGMHALYEGKKQETPELAIEYQGPAKI